MEKKRSTGGRFRVHVRAFDHRVTRAVGNRPMETMEKQRQTVGAQNVHVDRKLFRFEENLPRFDRIRVQTEFEQRFRTRSIARSKPGETMNRIERVDLHEGVFVLTDQRHSLPIGGENRMEKFDRHLIFRQNANDRQTLQIVRFVQQSFVRVVFRIDFDET